MSEHFPRDHSVEIRDARLLLRAFRLEDADAAHEAVCQSRSELSRWLPWCHAHYTRQDMLEFLGDRAAAYEEEQEFAFAIWDRASGEFLGAIGLNQMDPFARRANLGYWLRTSATGQGIATTATRLLARWAFEELGLERLEIVADVDNLASHRVAERAGALREGIARNRLRLGERQRDAAVFSLVPSDFSSQNG